MKTCKKCGQELPTSSFNKHATNTDGLTGKCNNCLIKERKAREAFNIVSVLTKTCKRCEKSLCSDKFIKNKSVIDGLNGWCKDCSKDSSLSHKYSITLSEYNDLLSKQEYKCKICLTDNPGGKGAFVVDHCHKSGVIRGLLCNHCNTGIGKLHDDAKLLLRAANYVQSDGVIK